MDNADERLNNYEFKQSMNSLLKDLIQRGEGEALKKVGCDSELMANHNIISEAFLEAAVEFGISEAHTDLGVLYLHHFEIIKRETGFHQYLIAARQGDSRAVRLYFRDSSWFDFNQYDDEMIQIGLRLNVIIAYKCYSNRLHLKGDIKGAIKYKKKIAYRDPEILIDVALLYLYDLEDKKNALKSLIRFGKIWYKYYLDEETYSFEHDDSYYTIFNVYDDDILKLSDLVKEEADSGNIEANFVYALFLYLGILLPEKNKILSKKYLEFALAGDIKNKDKIRKLFDYSNCGEEICEQS